MTYRSAWVRRRVGNSPRKGVRRGGLGVLFQHQTHGCWHRPRSPVVSAARQVEIDDVATTAQSRHPFFDDRRAAIGSGGEALIQIRAYAETLPQRFAQVFLVAAR